MPRDLLSASSVPDELAARVAAGPGFWAGWLDELDRGGLLEELLGRDVIERALEEAPGAHRYDSALNAKMTLVCVLVACLFPGEGYDRVLARAFGLPGLRFRPGKAPTASALSQARERLGDHAVRRLFEIDAGTGDAELGLTALWHGLEVTAIDGTTMELDRSDALACEFGSSSEAGRPLLRIVGHVRVATRRWIAAEPGSYHQGENELADRLLGSFRSGIVNLADRGFPSMERYLAAAGTGADLVWRWKNDAKSLPAKTLEVLPDGSELVVMRESDGMLARRRRESRNHAAPRLPDTIARLVTFMIMTETASGKRKATRVRVLTTLLDHEELPAREIAQLYAQRWQIEIAFLHLKATVRGSRRELRGQSPALARQEAWGLLLVHNITATAVARAAVRAGTDPKLIPFAPALALIRDRVTADACCPHCGLRPVPAKDQASVMIDDIARLPRHRPGRQRTSGRTTAERRNGRTENVTYTITIEESNLPEWDSSPNT
ncbi:MAG: transposase [Actinomycetia bacterium]|nr:transposase [Actinomycetes bacterium]